MNALNTIPLASGQPALVERWAQICIEAHSREEAWIAKLRSEGIKAAHPDDGWVDRKKNTVHFAYPQFNDGAGVGDKIALGWADDYRIVTLTGRADGMFLERWLFQKKYACQHFGDNGTSDHVCPDCYITQQIRGGRSC